MAKEPEQVSMFDEHEGALWGDEWHDMPEFQQDDLTSFHQVIVHFETREDMKKFSELIGQQVRPTTRSIWYPEAEIGRMSNKRYVCK